jgi:5-methyltetrahydropteroyltriglutamate--homocysteine methyltransferase
VYEVSCADIPVTSWAGRREYRADDRAVPTAARGRVRPVRRPFALSSRRRDLREPALRETLPLRPADRPSYLAWATEAFRLTTGGVRPDTQVHTHMCYAEFGDIVQAIDDLDADVISLEAARSHMRVARELAVQGYPREAGPGVYDIHSPRVPSTEEAAELLRTGLRAIPAERLWVNPDCGLKTRGWPETRASLENLVTAARTVRDELS